jgi:hypothetical protein
LFDTIFRLILFSSFEGALVVAEAVSSWRTLRTTVDEVDIATVVELYHIRFSTTCFHPLYDGEGVWVGENSCFDILPLDVRVAVRVSEKARF